MSSESADEKKKSLGEKICDYFKPPLWWRLMKEAYSNRPYEDKKDPE